MDYKNVFIAEELHERLKLASVLTKRTMVDIVEEALDRYLATLPGQQYLILKEKESTT